MAVLVGGVLMMTMNVMMVMTDDADGGGDADGGDDADGDEDHLT